MMHMSTFAIAALLLAASHVHAQNSTVVQREFSDRGARFIELTQSSVSKPAYRVNAGGHSISRSSSRRLPNACHDTSAVTAISASVAIPCISAPPRGHATR